MTGYAGAWLNNPSVLNPGGISTLHKILAEVTRISWVCVTVVRIVSLILLPSYEVTVSWEGKLKWVKKYIYQWNWFSPRSYHPLTGTNTRIHLHDMRITVNLKLIRKCTSNSLVGKWNIFVTLRSELPMTVVLVIRNSIVAASSCSTYESQDDESIFKN